MYTQDTVFFGAFSHPLIPAVSRLKDRFVRQSKIDSFDSRTGACRWNRLGRRWRKLCRIPGSIPRPTRESGSRIPPVYGTKFSTRPRTGHILGSISAVTKMFARRSRSSRYSIVLSHRSGSDSYPLTIHTRRSSRRLTLGVGSRYPGGPVASIVPRSRRRSRMCRWR